MITNPLIDAYVSRLIPPRSPLLTRLEREAAAEGIPIIQLPAAQVMRSLLLLHQPRSILEIGTAIGYSTIWLAEAAPQANIVTMEMDEERIARARANFAEAGLSGRIELIAGDAAKGLPKTRQFDCLFIDAAKGQYQTFLDLYLPLLNENGLLICDNVLFRGLVAAPEEASKRQRPLVEKLDRVNVWLSEHPDLATSWIPVGDGLAVSIKRTKKTT